MLFELWRLSGLNVMNELRPTFKPELARENELHVGQYRIGNVRFVFAQPFSGNGIAVPQCV
jgi:hypothetical protein